MLNITENSVSQFVKLERYKSTQILASRKHGKTLLRVMITLGSALLIVLILPWTQNIRSNGEVTTLKQEMDFVQQFSNGALLKTRLNDLEFYDPLSHIRIKQG